MTDHRDPDSRPTAQDDAIAMGRCPHCDGSRCDGDCIPFEDG